MVTILPSILSADFGQLAQQIAAIEAAGADMHHVDVMDGHFVPNISFGTVVVEAIARHATKPLDLHLMISEPAKYIETFAKVRPELMTIHAEAEGDIASVLQKIRQLGSKAGVSIKPDTSFAAITPLLPYVDVLLIMSVEPGFGGQTFMPTAVAKIREAAAYIAEHKHTTIIEVDGGITKDNIAAVTEAGATWVVAGSSVYTKNGAFAQNIAALRANSEE